MKYDTLISGGTIVDGSGAQRFQADLAIDAGRIAAIGALPDCDARETIDARGMIVAPGFVDVHTHDDRAVLIKVSHFIVCLPLPPPAPLSLWERGWG